MNKLRIFLAVIPLVMYTYKTQSQSVFVIKVQKEDKLVFKVIGHIFLFYLFLFFTALRFSVYQII